MNAEIGEAPLRTLRNNLFSQRNSSPQPILRCEFSSINPGILPENFGIGVYGIGSNTNGWVN
jgi:hypothetical protein